jgi:hypothetical protein
LHPCQEDSHTNRTDHCAVLSDRVVL